MRGGDFSESAPDVRVDDFASLDIDCKYRKQSWSHHRYLDELDKKYPGTPVLVTKNHRQRGAVVSMKLEDFAELLDKVRVLQELAR